MSRSMSLSADLRVQDIVKTWDRLEKLEEDLKDKPEQTNVGRLKKQVNDVAKYLICHHVNSQLADFISSQQAHATSKMKCLPLPSWPVLELRKYLPNDPIFRTETEP